MKPLPRTTLSSILLLLVICIIGLVWGTTLPYVLGTSRSISERQSIELVRSRAELAGKELARALSTQWHRVRAAAQFTANEQNLSELRPRFSTIVAANSDIPWIGLADISGKIVIASNGLLEGQRANERPWFRAGAEAPYVGDKHEAVLLASHMRTQADEPARLIDFAMPVSRNNTLIGVVAMHIDWVWVRSLLEPFDQKDGVDIILLSRNGVVLAGPPTMLGQQLRQQSASAAMQGAKVSATETWPDAVTYLVATVPVPGQPDLPSFGWSVLVRQPTTLAFAPVQSFTKMALTIAAAGAVLCLVLALFIARLLGRPMVRLAEAAHDMAQGQYSRPIPDERAYREVASLASALVHLQSTVLSRTERLQTDSQKAREYTIV
jgi:HAMP domain-containing protein